MVSTNQKNIITFNSQCKTILLQQAIKGFKNTKKKLLIVYPTLCNKFANYENKNVDEKPNNLNFDVFLISKH